VAQPGPRADPDARRSASLPSGLAINAIIFNSARFIGPAVTGIVIANVSRRGGFAVMPGTYVVFLVAMTNLRGIPALPVAATRACSRPQPKPMVAARHPRIAPMLLLFTGDDSRTRGFVELFPGFADHVFGRGPRRLGDLGLDGAPDFLGERWMLLRPRSPDDRHLVLG